MRHISPARATAFEVLEEVAIGAYASDALRARSRLLDARDAALASQLVFGCLRWQLQLDFLISAYSGKQIEALDVPVAVALRAALFQIRHLDRVPAHAAVNESVEWIKHRRRSAAGLVNAVLRKAGRQPAPAWPDEATALSCPGWLLERWRQHFGAAQAVAIAKAALAEPAAYVRIRPGETPPPGLEVEPTELEGCWRVISGGDGGLRLHDISSQAIVPLLELQAGQSYLDLCAAPGNKTVQALEAGPGLAIACDLSERRIHTIPPVCPRVVLDATCVLPFEAKFDRIFIDAPCSGTGTLAPNPEIKWRVRPEEFARFGKRQAQIVERAIPHLAPGGKLVYATCSLEAEENEEVVRQIMGLRREREVWRLPGRDEGDGFYAAVLTNS